MASSRETLEWLKTALYNQRDNVKYGSSSKFPCENELEIQNSLKAIEGMLKLIDECRDSLF